MDLTDLKNTLIASSLGGLFARIVLHPIDTVKTIKQAAHLPVSTSSIVKDIMKTSGGLGFYRGFFVAAAGSIPGVCLYMTSFEFFRHQISSLSNVPAPLVNFASGFLAEAFSCVVFVPVDVIKEQLQASKASISYKSISTLLSNRGIRGLYKGYGATLASFGPFSALYFLFEGQLSPIFGNTLYGTLGCAAISGGAAALITSPLDLVKVRLQLQYPYKGTIDGLRTIVSEEGFRGLMRGAGPRVLFSTANTAVTLGTIRYIKNTLAS